jgi:hypothetical protein
MCKSVASQITSENGRISPPGRCAVRFSYFYTSSLPLFVPSGEHLAIRPALTRFRVYP